MSRFKVDVPVGTSGVWAVRKFSVGLDDAAMFNMGARGRSILPGEYTRLTRNSSVIMSDTPAEVSDHLSFIYRARRTGGRVLVHGLGLGMCVNAILQEDEGKPSKVEHVLVVEQSSDVIALTAPHYRDKFPGKLEIRQGDAYTWKPEKGERWSCVWHDIWDNLCVDNLPKMTTLHRRFGRRCDWQDSWGRALLRRQAKRDKQLKSRWGW